MKISVEYSRDLHFVTVANDYFPIINTQEGF